MKLLSFYKCFFSLLTAVLCFVVSLSYASSIDGATTVSYKFELTNQANVPDKFLNGYQLVFNNKLFCSP